LSAFKVERGKLLEALARQLDWPSRAEIDSLHRQVRSLTTAAAKAAAATQPAAARKAAAAKSAAAKAKSRKASKRGVK
jgi:ribosomal protein L12E/L44/L45/RPP1/RPP2